MKAPSGDVMGLVGASCCCSFLFCAAACNARNLSVGESHVPCGEVLAVVDFGLAARLLCDVVEKCARVAKVFREGQNVCPRVKTAMTLRRDFDGEIDFLFGGTFRPKALTVGNRPCKLLFDLVKYINFSWHSTLQKDGEREHQMC